MSKKNLCFYRAKTKKSSGFQPSSSHETSGALTGVFSGNPVSISAGMSNSNCFAGRIVSLNVEKIVSGPQMKNYPIFLSVLTVLFSDHTVSIEGFEHFDHFK